ncbi:formate-dependent phosphoribosylglycinamide formyltransferase [Terribacillus saccharophilus]|uniref:formate-dependent phosphoribosylglycinamide formyltransferase n=1 Tax=Terribacillus saccharophilus TaxID=361277 RepID=UPI003981F457
MYKTKKMLLLGSGELGKEVVIEAQRLGLETIAVDRYDGAPAMAVADRSYVIDMLDRDKLRQIAEWEKPDFIVPEIEAIATDELVELEKEGYHVVPTAKAAQLTMDREGIRRFAAETLDIPTADYRFADTYEAFQAAVEEIGFPCVIKPLMSSSGKGQSVCRSTEDMEISWKIAMEGGRVQKPRIIVEEFIQFDAEITLLTVRAINGTFFCDPIGHEQEKGDYIASWQPHQLTEDQLEQAQGIAERITTGLGGYGIFGVELFLAGDHVYFSEVSPRPHDTGMVTMVTQQLSQFALHVRAILGLPITEIKSVRPGATSPLKAEETFDSYHITGMGEALQEPQTQIRVFGKPVTTEGRRVAVVLSTADTAEEARVRAERARGNLQVAEHDELS